MKKFYFLVLLLLTFSAFAQNYSYTVYNTSNSSIASNYVGDIKIDANGLLWISSFSGVSTFNGTTFTNYNTSNSSISSNAILKIEIDGLGRKWMATQFNGISRLSGSTWANYTTSNSALPNNTIKDIAVDGLNNLWVVTASGLTKFNGTTWATYSALTNINSIAIDSNNGVWVSAGNILYKFNGTDFNIITDGVQKILRIANNTIYIDAFDALMTYSTAGTFINLQYQSNSCLAGYQYNALDVNSNNKAWIAFQGDGLQNFTDCISYTSNSGLPDNYISTVRTQANGTIWAGTLQLGLTKMTPSASTCSAPTQTWAENITPTTATLNWIPAVPSPDSYVIRYNTTNVIGGIQDATASTSISIANLNSNADYYWWVASVCGEQQSNWTFGGFFGTPQSATCNAPTNTIIYNLGSTSCLIGWTAPTPVPTSGYEVYLSTSSVTPGVTTTPTYTSTSTSVNIPNGLAPATSYYVWVRSNCGGTKSNWTPVVNFVTNNLSGCNTAEHGLFPAGTFTPACSGANETIVTNAWAGEYTNVNVNANQQYTFSSSFTTDIITITNDANVILASGQTPLSWSSGSTSGVIRYYLHANTLCHSQNTNRTRYIQCVASQSCGVPTNLAVSNITSNSCRLNWTAPTPSPTEYDIYIITTNTAPTSSTVATATSFTAGVGVLNGLASSTTYYYWIRSSCNGTKSAWVSGGSFMTTAALICNGASNGLYPNATFIPTCTGGFEQITPAAYAGEYSNVNTLANKQYTFTSSIATDYITITNVTGTTLLASGTTPLVWNSTTGGTIRYYIHTNANCGDQNTNRIRSIKCENASAACNVPTQLYYDGLSSTSNNIGWVAPTPAPSNGYVYCYSTVNDPFSAGAITGATTDTFAVLSNLSPNTTYYFWVKSNCGNTQTNWVSGGSFTTYPASGCNAPTQLYYDGLSSTSNNIGWENPIPAPSNGYVYCYSTVNDPFSAGAITGTTTDTFAVLSNLSPNTTYYFWVKSNCGNTQTNWVSGPSFTTPQAGSCNPPTQFWTDGINATTATIGWVPPTNTPDSYIYTYNTTNEIIDIQYSTAFTSATLENLTPNTDYHWWVASVCGETQTAWTYGGVFTTLQGTPTYCFEKIAGGRNFTLAIKSDGTLWAWGNNSYGQLGDGTTVNKLVPTQIGTSTDWESISAGFGHSVAIKNNGTLWTWGFNLQGQLGDGTNTNKTVPTQIGTATNWETVEARGQHNIAKKSNGTLWAWGSNSFSQLGDGTAINRYSPIQIGTATNWQSIGTGGAHSMAIKTDGTLWCWGFNSNGQVGDGTTTNRYVPTQIGTATNWKSVTGGSYFTIATKTNNSLWTWGRNYNGELGLNDTTDRSVPTQVGTATNWDKIAAGEDHALASRTYGALFAWGYDSVGQVGNGSSTENILAPTLLLNVPSWIGLKAGGTHSLAIDNEGKLYTWGNNSEGQLGNGSTTIDYEVYGFLPCPNNNLSVEDISQMNNLKIYPNPVTDALNIAAMQDITSVSVYNMLGQEVIVKAIHANEVSINMSNLASGTYLVKVSTGNAVKTVKVIKL